MNMTALIKYYNLELYYFQWKLLYFHVYRSIDIKIRKSTKFYWLYSFLIVFVYLEFWYIYNVTLVDSWS